LTLNKIKQSFVILKALYAENKGSASREDLESRGENGDLALQKQVRDLKSLLLQRDNEIAILVNMVKSGKTAEDVATAERARSSGGTGAKTPAKEGTGDVARERSNRDEDSKVAREKGLADSAQAQRQQRESKIIHKHLFGIPPPEDRSLFEDPAACFEWFRERHELSGSIEENKNVLRDKYNEAKVMGERANQSRNTINYLKNSIEAIRRERAIQGTLPRDSSAEDEKETEEEETYRRAIEQEKVVYRDSFEKLRILKPEIEHIKLLLEKGRSTLQAHFDQWFNSLYARQGTILSGPSGGLPRNAPSPLRSSLDNSALTNQNSAISTAAEAKGTGLRASLGAGSKDADEVNEDILAFYQAKEELMKRRQAK
jgi:kinesin family protein 6/9